MRINFLFFFWFCDFAHLEWRVLNLQAEFDFDWEERSNSKKKDALLWSLPMKSIWLWTQSIQRINYWALEPNIERKRGEKTKKNSPKLKRNVWTFFEHNYWTKYKYRVHMRCAFWNAIPTVYSVRCDLRLNFFFFSLAKRTFIPLNQINIHSRYYFCLAFVLCNFRAISAGCGLRSHIFNFNMYNE